MMVSANQIRDMVSDYLLGSIDLEMFSRKFAAVFDDIEDSGDEEAIQLSYKIESILADLSAGLIAEKKVRECLTSLVTKYTIPVNFGAKDVFILQFGSSNVAVEPFGTKSVAVFSSSDLRSHTHQTSTALLR
jgi:hypothetical protein